MKQIVNPDGALKIDALGLSIPVATLAALPVQEAGNNGMVLVQDKYEATVAGTVSADGITAQRFTVRFTVERLPETPAEQDAIAARVAKNARSKADRDSKADAVTERTIARVVAAHKEATAQAPKDALTETVASVLRQSVAANLQRVFGAPALPPGQTAE